MCRAHFEKRLREAYLRYPRKEFLLTYICSMSTHILNMKPLALIILEF